MVEAEIVNAKIRSLMRCLACVRTTLPDTVQALEANLDAQDIVTLNLQRSGQACVDIATHVIADQGQPPPPTMSGAFLQLERKGWISPGVADAMRQAVGFRNVAVHQYQQIRWGMVHRIASEHLDDFRTFIAELQAANVIAPVGDFGQES